MQSRIKQRRQILRKLYNYSGFLIIGNEILVKNLFNYIYYEKRFLWYQLCVVNNLIAIKVWMIKPGNDSCFERFPLFTSRYSQIGSHEPFICRQGIGRSGERRCRNNSFLYSTGIIQYSTGVIQKSLSPLHDIRFVRYETVSVLMI